MTDECVEIDHVAIAVEDLESAVSWYSAALGFREVERRTTEGKFTAMRSSVLVSGSATVVLVQGTSSDCQVNQFIRRFGPGVQHLAFRVQNLSQALDRAEAGGGVAEISVVESSLARQVFLQRDPSSGVRVELIERLGNPGFDGESVRRIFRALEKKGAY